MNEGAAILLPTAALLLGAGILTFAIARRGYQRPPVTRETFADALDRKDARIAALEHENKVLRSHMTPSQRLSADSLLRFEREHRE